MRNFFWCRQELAEMCTHVGEHTHVCITTPGYRKITPSCGKKFINFLFCDLDPEAIRRSVRYGEDPVVGEEYARNCLSDAQTREMVAFIKSSDTDLVVNCEAGISRSAGVVLALRRFYGGDTEEPFNRAHPNIYVATMVYRVLHEESSSQ